MWLVLLFGGFLLLAVLISERARTTILSTSVMFLVVGIAIGRTGLGWFGVPPSHPLVATTAELALFTILFVDGNQLRARDIAGAWHLPGRALLVGLPLTIGVVALAARWVLGLPWRPALLIGTVLSPTDPVMIRSLLEQEAVPLRLRRLLSVESGLNDGLALPPLIVLLGLVGAAEPTPWQLVLETLGGVALGIAAGALVAVTRVRWFGITHMYRPLLGVAIACLVFGACRQIGWNELLGAFAAGVTMASVEPELAAAFVHLGEPISEAVKLGALLVFGATLALHLDAAALAFAAVTLLAARPIALLFAFLGGGLSRKEWLVAAWFGPKGFSSILYGALVIASGAPGAERLYAVIGLVVAISIVAHSSSDFLVARMFARAGATSAPSGRSSEASR